MKKRSLRAVEYYTVDVVTFAGNILLSWVLVEYLSAQYVIATIAGFAFQTISAFFVNEKWTFKKRHIRVGRGLFMTTLAQGCALLIAVGGVMYGVEVLHLPFLPARIISGAIAGIIGYIIDSSVTFGVSVLD